MNVSRIVIAKVMQPEPLIEINLEYDQRNGTTDVITVYSKPKNMKLEIHNNMVSMNPVYGGQGYSADYRVFRDSRRIEFSSPQEVHDYIMIKNGKGFSADRVRKVPQGAKLYV